MRDFIEPGQAEFDAEFLDLAGRNPEFCSSTQTIRTDVAPVDRTGGPEMGYYALGPGQAGYIISRPSQRDLEDQRRQGLL